MRLLPFIPQFSQICIAGRPMGICLLVLGSLTSALGQYQEDCFVPQTGNYFTTLYQAESAKEVVSFPQRSEMIEFRGKYYGLTALGGTSNLGLLVDYNPATNTYTKLKEFVMADGAAPVGPLTVYHGKLYGLTRSGGAADEGVLFEYDPASQVYRVRKDFAMLEGYYPYGSLVVRDNKLYGLPAKAGGKAEQIEIAPEPLLSSYTKKN